MKVAITNDYIRPCRIWSDPISKQLKWCRFNSSSKEESPPGAGSSPSLPYRCYFPHWFYSIWGININMFLFLACNGSAIRPVIPPSPPPQPHSVLNGNRYKEMASLKLSSMSLFHIDCNESQLESDTNSDGIKVSFKLDFILIWNRKEKKKEWRWKMGAG